ncbi:hypothetical protein [Oscillatoria sp. HE19RPO]|uniref:hypothetical protein n=1 Tax=Oscillatoria sp. HE19RPO TaxID=2954806 RepID=UPI0020C45331|nr:hypothetical protein [Oscillatoria sp. HE19RPO]
MPILSNVERRAMEAARQQGIQLVREIVLEVLNDLFNPVPPAVTDRINQISDLATLKQLLKRGISIGSLAEFEQVLESMLTLD